MTESFKFNEPEPNIFRMLTYIYVYIANADIYNTFYEGENAIKIWEKAKARHNLTKNNKKDKNKNKCGMHTFIFDIYEIR